MTIRTFRIAERADEELLWEMLFYAASMHEDGVDDYRAAKENAFLRAYVEGWGRDGDYGLLAIEQASGAAIGAAWLRRIEGELAVAIRPAFRGQGVGSALIAALLKKLPSCYQQIVLSVREENPAYRIYQRLGFVTLSETTNRVGGRSFVMLWTSQGAP
jgi:ribosomal protein S18 acetylase RimI-like enzyme